MWSLHKAWYNHQIEICDFLDFASSSGAKGVELLSVFWKDIAQELPLVDQALRKNGLKVSSYAASNNFVHRDSEEREKQLMEVKDAIDLAQHFETNIVRVFSGHITEPSITYEEGLQYVIEGLSRAASYAENKGILLCIENHGLFAGKSNQMREIIQQVGSPNVRSTFDTGNFLLVGQNPTDAVVDMSDLISHVHIKDFQQVTHHEDALKSTNGNLYLGKIAGAGEIDLPFILETLMKIHYDGWLVVEFEGTEEEKEGSIKSMHYLKHILEQKIV
ncbi:sugar phosphate isomerase/epimerase [Pullulanibacillus pueri]|nr:sugar phosphate isomerase/epimerase [Pullulanibacillus pueri]